MKSLGYTEKVLILRYGNCANEKMLGYLLEAWQELEKQLSDGDVRLILLGRESMEIYHMPQKELLGNFTEFCKTNWQASLTLVDNAHKTMQNRKSYL